MAKIARTDDGYTMFFCPGCKEPHALNTAPGGWSWNGSHDAPSFVPSIRVFKEDNVTLCHSFVTEGKIAFCGDSPHALSGQTVELPEWKGAITDPQS